MSKYISPLLLLVALAILALLTFMALISKNSHAGTLYCGGPFDPSCAEVEYRLKLKRQARARARARERAEDRRERRARRHTRVYGYQREERDSVTCKDTIQVIGDARPTEAAAKDDAEAAFMRATRFKYGESWMSVENARGYAIRCARASITEIVGATMHRCEIKARPCRAPFQSRDDR